MGFFHPAFHVGVFSSARQLLDPPIPGTPRPADAPPFRRGHSRPTLNADAIFCVLALPLRRSLPGPSRLLEDPLAILRSSSASLRPRRSTPPLPRVGCPAITAPVPTRARAALREVLPDAAGSARRVALIRLACLCECLMDRGHTYGKPATMAGHHVVE
jgi:hypothetical protein